MSDGIRSLISTGPDVWKSVRSTRTWGGTTPTGDRNDLVYGSYNPYTTADSYGLLNASLLTDYNAQATNTVTIPAGAVISNKTIYGDVTFAGAATLTNCKLVGSNAAASGDTGVLRCLNTRTGVAVLIDCEIAPRVESNARNCALGWQYELYRCWLHGGVDGAGIYKTSSPYTCDVKIKGCVIEDLAYFYPDDVTTSHSDGTHNDLIQIQGGTNIEIVGNALVGTAHAGPGSGVNPDKPWLLTGSWKWNNGSCIIIQKNISAAPAFDSTVIITDNFFYGGLAQLLIKSTANSFVAQRNKFSAVSEPAHGPSYNEYWIRFDAISSSTNVSGLTSGGAVSNTTNVWLDGTNAGAALTAPRGSGISTSG